MRLIHTSDWHLGRSLFGTSLLEDQAYILDQLVEVVKDSRPDVVLVVGDLFERATPSTEAVELLDRTLSRLILDSKVKVVLLPGQHDSASRLSFCSWLLDKRGLHLVTTLEQALNPLVFEDADGPVHLHAIPYLDPSVIARQFKDEKADTHGSALNVLLDHLTRFRRLRRKTVRGVVAAYLHLEGGQRAGSERPLGGPEEGLVKADSFAGISYGALGYLHAPQALGEGQLCYSGAPLAYSFEEAGQARGLNRVEISRDGTARVERVELRPLRRLHGLEEPLERLLEGPPDRVRPEDYLLLRLPEGANPTGEQMEQLRRLYPNLLYLDRPALRAVEQAGELPEKPLMELFGSFFARVTGGPLEEEDQRILQEVLQEEDLARGLRV